MPVNLPPTLDRGCEILPVFLNLPPTLDRGCEILPVFQAIRRQECPMAFMN